jgi:hypothetical protein
VRLSPTAHLPPLAIASLLERGRQVTNPDTFLGYAQCYLLANQKFQPQLSTSFTLPGSEAPLLRALTYHCLRQQAVFEQPRDLLFQLQNDVLHPNEGVAVAAALCLSCVPTDRVATWERFLLQSFSRQDVRSEACAILAQYVISTWPSDPWWLPQIAALLPGLLEVT